MYSRLGSDRFGSLAERFLRDANLWGKPCSAFVLAAAAGLWLQPAGKGKPRGPVRGVIHYDDRASAEWQDAFVRRCVAAWVLWWYREPRDAKAIASLAHALRDRPQNPNWRELSVRVGGVA